jgi:hypothetical protein
MTLENLVKTHQLKPHQTNPDEVGRLLTAARRNLRDARIAELSATTRFDVAYKAVMQCSLLAAMVAGFRPSTSMPGHHATVIQTLSVTLGLPGEHVIVLDALRRKRNLSDYSGDGVSEEEAAACLRAAETLLHDVEIWLATQHNMHM